MTEADPVAYVLGVAEWDWVVTTTWRVLHHAECIDDPEFFADAMSGHGRTTCGVRGWISIPGFVSRLTKPRCRKCCRMLGFPEGIGSPKNDPACRPLVEARLAARGPEPEGERRP